jgi:hypothetical protein
MKAHIWEAKMSASRRRERGRSTAIANGPEATAATVSEVGTGRRRRSNGTANEATIATVAAPRNQGRNRLGRLLVEADAKARASIRGAA